MEKSFRPVDNAANQPSVSLSQIHTVNARGVSSQFSCVEYLSQAW